MLLKTIERIARTNIVRKMHSSSVLFDARIIDGNSIANDVHNEVKIEVENWVKLGKKRPKLIAIMVGEDPASKTYVARKMKVAKSVGIESETLKFNSSISSTELVNTINKLNTDPEVDGIIVQLPLPNHIDETTACQAIVSAKDVDGFHTDNIGKLTLGIKGIVPATPAGVKELILRSNIPTFGKNAVVVGRSKNVGLPIALLLHADGQGQTKALDMTTTICHRHTPPEQLSKFTRSADILVTATGIPGLIKQDMVKMGAAVIDVGITRVQGPNGKARLVGDVDFEAVKQIAGHITPVPGGVGPMTVAMLMKNTMIAVRINDHNQFPTA